MQQILGVSMVAVGSLVAIGAAATPSEYATGVIGIGVLTAGMVLVRWTLRTSERVESTFIGAIAAAEARAVAAEEDAERWRLRYHDECEHRHSHQEDSSDTET